MFKNWAVTFYNVDLKRVKVDTFTAATEAEARHDFREVYRHHEYKILSVVEIPSEGRAEQ